MTNTDDQNLTIIGEVLVQLDEDNIPRKKPPIIEDQYALDAQGRRRFHGAFTGGFSAGYFNSVDTRDGWRPHQFVSSRTKKAGRVCQRPEDFMDDEDTGEHGIGSIGIRASNEFANHTGKGIKRKIADTDNGPIPGSPVLRDLLTFVTDTVGVRLLKKMGWKPGQGVGPRLTKAEKKITSKKRTIREIYDCSLSNEEIKTAVGHPGTSNEDVEVYRGILFAPDDLEPLRGKPKDNYFGIGYSGLNKMSMIPDETNLVDSPVFQMHDKSKKLSIRGQAFGVGAFEADDADIYQCDDMSHYDFVLDSEEEKNNRWSNQKIYKLQRCSLQGFTIAESRFERKKLFSPPTGLENFEPIHVIKQSRFSAAIHEAKISNECIGENQAMNIYDAHNKRKLDDLNPLARTNERIQTLHKLKLLIEQNPNAENVLQCGINSQILGSVVERHSAATRPTMEIQKSISTSSWMDKLITRSFVQGCVELPNEIPAQNSAGYEKLKITTLSSETCDFGISMKQNSDSIQNPVKPFIYDVDQQRRLKISNQSPKSDVGQKLELIQSLPLKEMTPATELIKSTDISPCSETRTGSKITIPNSSCDNFTNNAAKIKVFGKMTRTLDVWRPVSALCKRFNISEPESGCAQRDIKKARSHCLFEFVDFCGETNTSDTKGQKALGTISTYGQSNISDKKCNHKFTDVENVTKSFGASNMICSDFSDKPKLENLYNTIPSRSVGTNFKSKQIKEQYSDYDFGENRETAEAMINNETNAKFFKRSPSIIQRNVSADAKHDIFKEIFLSCSELSESDNESTEGIHSGTVDLLLIGKHELNSQRNTSPATGIFAQLNLDESTGFVNPTKFGLQHSSHLRTDVSDTNTSKEKDSEIVDIIECGMEGSSDIYGPALPTKMFNTPNEFSCHPDSLNKVASKHTAVKKLGLPGMTSIWVEKSKMKKSKRTKKKQKNKRKDRKHKYVSD